MNDLVNMWNDPKYNTIIKLILWFIFIIFVFCLALFSNRNRVKNENNIPKENNNKISRSGNKDLDNQPINKPSIFDLFKIKQTRIKTPFYNKISDSSENNIEENNNDIKIIKGIDNFKLIYQDKEEILNADSFIISSLNVYGIPQSVKYPIIELLMFKEGYINDESELLNKENINSLIGLLNNIANTLKFYDKTYYKMIIENINMLYKIIRTKLYEYKDLDNLYKAFNQYDGFIDELFKQNLIS